MAYKYRGLTLVVNTSRNEHYSKLEEDYGLRGLRILMIVVYEDCEF